MQIEDELKGLGNPQKARALSRFFKTGKGEYGEGDVFLGVAVPQTRQVAKKHAGMELVGVQKLLNSRIHEHRLAALLILVEKYKRADVKERKRIFEFYLQNARKVNNWDLVDLSAPKIVGMHLLAGNRAILRKLAKSRNIWERRIAIVSTYAFIREDEYAETLRISRMLLEDEHDLIHKAVGWMLREVGKKDQGVEEEFLMKHYKTMPRTMLRYAIEKFDKKKREFYMN
jgi:3-methyladenine DNA glycosylase AlkD